MLWRTGYQTIIAEYLKLPVPLPVGIIIAIPSVDGLKDAEIWRKLIVQEFPAPVHLLIGTWSEETIEATFPRSVRAKIHQEPSREVWQEFLKEERTFAFVSTGETAQIVMWGPPTEEAWDQFQATARPVSS